MNIDNIIFFSIIGFAIFVCVASFIDMERQLKEFDKKQKDDGELF